MQCLIQFCIFRRHFSFRSSFVIRSCNDFQLLENDHRRDIGRSRCTTVSCFTDIHHLRICRRIRLDYTRQPSLQTFRPGCLVNYTLSLSNADPAYRNKGRSAGAPHERWDERRLLMNSALSTSRLFPIYHH